MGTGIVFATVVIVTMVALFIALYLRYRGKRIVTCPETLLPVGAEISAALAAGTWMTARPHLVVTACSRWPERAGCDQACASQVEAAPEETLVRSIVTRWYGERTCFYCAQPIGEISGAVVPALLDSDGALREWKDVAAEDLPGALANSVAVCAKCELAEDFRHRFPNLVTMRPDTPLRNRLIH